MSTKTVKVFGGPLPCSKCKNVERIFAEVAKESGIDAHVVHMSALSD